MRNYFLFSVVAAALLWVIACSPEKEAIRQIDKPLPEVSLGQETFIIDTSKDTLLEMKSGSSIFIPANSIVDADNKPVAEVKFMYEEYTDVASMLLSGIPMTYDSAGESNIFQSAGMFWVNATKTDGEQLFVSDDKEIEVNIVSDVSDETGEFNFYEFDTATGNWNYLTTASADEYIPESEEITEETNEGYVYTGPKIDFVFEMEFTNDYADAEEFNNMLWKYSGNKEYKDPEMESWIFTTSWTTTDIEKDPDNEGEYILELYNNETSFVTSIVPVKGQNYSNEEFNEQVEELDENIVKITNANLQARNEERFKRTMGLSGFGYFNWDAIHKFRKTINAQVEFMAEGSKITNPTRIYQVFTEINGMVEHNPDGKNSVVLTPDMDYLFIAINTDGTVLLCEETYNLFNEFSNGGRKSVDLISTGITIRTKEDLSEIIG